MMDLYSCRSIWICHHHYYQMGRKKYGNVNDWPFFPTKSNIAIKSVDFSRERKEENLLHSIGSIFIIFFYIHSLLNTWLPNVEYWRKEMTKWQFWMKPLSFHYYYYRLLLLSSSLLSFILSLETYINIIEEGINRKEHQGGTNLWTRTTETII